MPVFQPDVREVRPVVNVSRGVQDTATNSALQAAWGVAKGALSGMARAELTGAEGHVSSVTAEDKYGTIVSAPQEGLEGPVAELNRDLDLTRIANARRQGVISADRARALVNIKLRQAINANPMFADDLRKRAESFLSDVSGSGMSIFEPTQREKEDAYIREQQLQAAVEEDIEAQQAGLSVEELRTYKHQKIRADYAELRIQELENQDTLNFREFRGAVGEIMVANQTDVLGYITAASRVGGFNPDEKRQAITDINMRAQQMRRFVDRNRGKMSREDASAMVEEIDGWREGAIELVENEDIAAVLAKQREASENAVTMAGLQRFSTISMLNRTGGQAFVEIGLKAMSDPKYNTVMRRIDPTWEALLSSDIEGANRYLGNMLRRIGGYEPLPGSAAYQIPSEEATTALAAQVATGELALTDSDQQSIQDTKDKAHKYLFDQAVDDSRTFDIYTRSYKAYKDVMASPDLQRGLKSAVQARVMSLRNRMLTGRHNPNFVNIEFDTVTHRPSVDESRPGDVIRTGGPAVVPKVRVTLNEAAVQAETDRLMIEEQLSPAAARARALEQVDLNEVRSLYEVASVYGGLSMEGKTIKEYLDESLAPRETEPRQSRRQQEQERREANRERLEQIPEADVRASGNVTVRETPTAGLTQEELSAEPPNEITPEQADRIKGAKTFDEKVNIIREIGIKDEDIENLIVYFRGEQG